MNKTTQGLRATVYACFASVFLGSSSGGYASPISIAITGTVRLVDDYGNFLNGAVQPGDLVTGTYTYESTTPDSNPIVGVGDYWHNSSPYGISLRINGIAFYTDPNDSDFLVEIVNDYLTPSSDNYALRSYKNVFDISVPNGMSFPPDNLISWQLDDPTATALDSEALPTVPPVLSDWQSIFGLDIFSANEYSEMFLIRADVTSAVRVPDSGSPIGTFVLGCLFLILVRRSKTSGWSSES